MIDIWDRKEEEYLQCVDENRIKKRVQTDAKERIHNMHRLSTLVAEKLQLYIQQQHQQQHQQQQQHQHENQNQNHGQKHSQNHVPSKNNAKDNQHHPDSAFIDTTRQSANLSSNSAIVSSSSSSSPSSPSLQAIITNIETVTAGVVLEKILNELTEEVTVVVRTIDPKSNAYHMGLRQGDTVHSINGQDIFQDISGALPHYHGNNCGENVDILYNFHHNLAIGSTITLGVSRRSVHDPSRYCSTCVTCLRHGSTAASPTSSTSSFSVATSANGIPSSTAIGVDHRSNHTSISTTTVSASTHDAHDAAISDSYKNAGGSHMALNFMVIKFVNFSPKHLSKYLEIVSKEIVPATSLSSLSANSSASTSSLQISSEATAMIILQLAQLQPALVDHCFDDSLQLALQSFDSAS
jgi:protein required for attachment to host cells